VSSPLVSQHIEVTVKYASAQKQIANDLLGLDKIAKRAGDDAGSALNQALTRAAQIDATDAKKSFLGFDNAAKSTGKNAGGELAEGIISGARSELNSGGKKMVSGLTDQFEGAGQKAGSGLVDGLGSKVAILGRAGGPIGLALAATVGLGAVVGGKLAQELMGGLEREMASRKVQVQLGLDEKGAANVSKAVTDAYKNNYGESIDDLNQTAQAVIKNNLANATDPAGLQKYIQQIDTVAAVTGDGAAELARSADVLVKSGVAKDINQALDLITVGNQKGLNASGDLLDTFTEYGVQFQKLGVDGPQALGLINQLMEGGARSTDLAADALKEFSIRSIDGSESSIDAYESLNLNAEQMMQTIAKGGPEANKAFDTVVDSLNAIQDPVERNRIGVQLFGTQWEDLGEAMRSLDPSAATATLGEVEGATQRASDVLGGGALSGFQSLGRTIETLRWQFQDFLAEALGPTAQKFTDWVNNNQGQIIEFFTGLASATLTGADAFLGFFQMTMEWGGKWQEFLSNTVGEVIKQIGGFAKATGELMKFVPGMQDEAEALIKLGDGSQSLVDGWRNQSKEMQDWAGKIGTAREGLRGVRDDVNAAGLNMAAAADNAQLLKTGLETLPDNKTIVLKDNTPEAIKRVEDLGYTVEKLPDGKLAIKVEYKDQNGNPISPDQLLNYNKAEFDSAGQAQRTRRGYARGGKVTGPGTGTSDSILAWLSNGEGVVKAQAMNNGGGAIVTALNAGWVPPADFLHRMIPGFAEGLNPGADFLRSQIMKLWPKIGTIGGRRSEDGYGEHSSGNAIDVMIPGYDTPDGKALGDSVASWVVANKEALGLDGMIWRQTSFGYGGSWAGKAMGDRGSDTQNHMDHLHLILGKGRGAGAPAVDLPSSSLSLPSGGSLSPGGGYSSGGGGSKASAKQLSAQQDRITDLENKLSTSELALSETEAKGDASESSLKSKRDAVDKNKRELEQARQELADMQNGTGDYATDGTGPGLDTNNPYLKIMEGVKEILPDFGQMADIGIGGLKETLLPPGFEDPQSWPVVQSLSGVMGFIGGLVGGIPGMEGVGKILGGVGSAIGGDASGATNSFMSLLPAPFGDTNIGSPTMLPEDFQAANHIGSGGLPGPGNLASAFTPDPEAAQGGTVNNDNSIHVAEGGQINENATQIMDKTQRQQNSQQMPHLGTRRFV
jgi:hypothetical protein